MPPPSLLAQPCDRISNYYEIKKEPDDKKSASNRYARILFYLLPRSLGINETIYRISQSCNIFSEEAKQRTRRPAAVGPRNDEFLLSVGALRNLNDAYATVEDD